MKKLDEMGGICIECKRINDAGESFNLVNDELFCDDCLKGICKP